MASFVLTNKDRVKLYLAICEDHDEDCLVALSSLLIFASRGARNSLDMLLRGQYFDRVIAANNTSRVAVLVSSSITMV